MHAYVRVWLCTYVWTSLPTRLLACPTACPCVCASLSLCACRVCVCPRQIWLPHSYKSTEIVGAVILLGPDNLPTSCCALRHGPMVVWHQAQKRWINEIKIWKSRIRANKLTSKLFQAENGRASFDLFTCLYYKTRRSTFCKCENINTIHMKNMW